MLAVLYGVYSLVRNSVGDVVARAYANGREILAVEDVWGLALERGLNEWVHRTDVVAGAVALHYATLHFLVTPAVLAWLFLRRPTRYRAASGILMVTTALALIGFYWLPTAPPRLLADEGFVDVMSQTSTWGWWPASGTPGSDAISNQFAAMPSLHCAWAAWCGIVLVLLVRRTWVRVVALVYPFTTFFVVLGSGNHYLLDVLAGVAVLCVGAGSCRSPGPPAAGCRARSALLPTTPHCPGQPPACRALRSPTRPSQSPHRRRAPGRRPCGVARLIRHHGDHPRRSAPQPAPRPAHRHRRRAAAGDRRQRRRPRALPRRAGLPRGRRPALRHRAAQCCDGVRRRGRSRVRRRPGGRAPGAPPPLPAAAWCCGRPTAGDRRDLPGSRRQPRRPPRRRPSPSTPPAGWPAVRSATTPGWCPDADAHDGDGRRPQRLARRGLSRARSGVVAVERRFRFPNRPRWATMSRARAKQPSDVRADHRSPGATMSGICTVDRRVPARAAAVAAA